MKLELLVLLLLAAIVGPSFAILSPGNGVGITDFYQSGYGPQRRTVVLDGQHGVHVYWTYRINGSQSTQRGYYNFRDETGSWAFGNTGTAHDVRVSRMGSLGVLSDGCACPTSHVSQGINILVTVSFDAARGAGAFTSYDIDPDSAYHIWPAIAVGGGDVVHVIASGLGGLYYSRNLSPWRLMCDGSSNAIAARGDKVSIAFCDSSLTGLYHFESTDRGISWGQRETTYLWSPSDSVWGSTGQDAVYNPLEELHIVFGVADTGGSTRSQIWHWSRATGISLVTSGWWVSKLGPGLATVSWPSLGQNPRTGHWYCVWQEFTLRDTSTIGVSNGELFAAFSTNNGLSWSPKTNLTKSATPDSPPGRCADDRYPSLAAVVPDSLIILYIAGLQDTSGRIPDTVRVLIVPVDSLSGIEADKEVVRHAPPSLKVSPNPFTSRVTISYTPTPHPLSLSLYDLSGRRVKSFSPHALRLTPHEVIWEGKDERGKPLPSGVYFVRLQTGGRSVQRRLLLIR